MSLIPKGNAKMTFYRKPHFWAATIILAATFCLSFGLNQGATFGIVGGLSGAAWGSMYGDSACARGCLE